MGPHPKNRLTTGNGGKSKAHQIKTFIKGHIIDGRYAEGAPIPSERELADLYSVSRQTIRAAISDLVHEDVLTTHQGRGTFVRGMAADGGPAGGPKTREVGVLIPSVEPGYYANLIQDIAHFLSEQSYHMILANYSALPETEEQQMAAMVDKGAAGLIVFPSYNSFTNQYYHNLRVKNVPFVLLDSPVQGVDADLVHIDNADSAYRGTKALITAGCRRIAFLCGYLTAWTSRERLLGCQKALWEHNLQLGHNMVFEGPFNKSFGHGTAAKLFRAQPPADGLVIANHEITQGVIKAVHEHELRIPEDLKICTFEQAGSPLHDVFPLVVVSQPTESMARAAVQALLKRIADHGKRESKSKSREICLPAHISIPAWAETAARGVGQKV